MCLGNFHLMKQILTPILFSSSFLYIYIYIFFFNYGSMITHLQETWKIHCPFKRRTFGHKETQRMCTDKGPCEDTGKREFQAKERGLRRVQACWHLDLALPGCSTVRNTILWLKAPSLLWSQQPLNSYISQTLPTSPKQHNLLEIYFSSNTVHYWHTGHLPT